MWSLKYEKSIFSKREFFDMLFLFKILVKDGKICSFYTIKEYSGLLTKLVDDGFSPIFFGTKVADSK